MRDDALERAKQVDVLTAEAAKLQQDIDDQLKKIADQQQAVSDKASADIQAAQDAATAATTALQTQLDADIKAAQDQATKDLDALKQSIADELEPQLKTLNDIRNGIIDEQIRRMDIQKEQLNTQIDTLNTIRDTLVTQFAALLNITKDEVAGYLKDIRDNTKNTVAAAAGLDTIVSQPTPFLTGEKGPEWVHIQPLSQLQPLQPLSQQRIEPIQAATSHSTPGPQIPITMENQYHITVNVPQGTSLDTEQLARRIVDLSERATLNSPRGGKLRAVVQDVIRYTN